VNPILVVGAETVVGANLSIHLADRYDVFAASLAGRLLLFDALHTPFAEVSIRRNPECPVCGDHPTITEYIDYVEFCTGAPGVHA